MAFDNGSKSELVISWTMGIIALVSWGYFILTVIHEVLS